MSWLDSTVIRSLADRTIRICPICHGKGVVIDGYILKNCQCVVQFKNLQRLTEAGIPERYWTFNFSDLNSKFQKDNSKVLKVLATYVKNIDRNLLEGNWLYLQGHSGLAKSAIAAYVLRMALDKNHKGYMVRLSHLTEIFFLSFEKPEYKALVKFLEQEADIIVVEEMDKVYAVKDSASIAGGKITQIFSTWYDRKAAVILTGNSPKTELKQVHNLSVLDRVNEAVDLVVIGESFRSKENTESRIAKQMQ